MGWIEYVAAEGGEDCDRVWVCPECGGPSEGEWDFLQEGTPLDEECSECGRHSDPTQCECGQCTHCEEDEDEDN